MINQDKVKVTIVGSPTGLVVNADGISDDFTRLQIASFISSALTVLLSYRPEVTTENSIIYSSSKILNDAQT